MGVVIAVPKIYLTEVGVVTRFWSRLSSAAVGVYQDGCFGIAKGAAYSALLSFFPIVTTIATLLVQANAEAVARTVARLLSDVIPPGTEDTVKNLFTVKGQQPAALLVVAVILAAWAGSGVMMSLMEGFQAIYRIQVTRSFVRERAIAMMLVFVTALPVLGASALIVFGNRAQRWLITQIGLNDGGGDLRGWVRLGGQALTFAIAVSAMVLVAVLIYYFGPNRKQAFHKLFPGAMVATLLWLISTLAIGWYIRHISNYNVLYGSVGAGLALLVWSYVLSVITLFGCEFNAVTEGPRTPAGS